MDPRTGNPATGWSPCPSCVPPTPPAGPGQPPPGPGGGGPPPPGTGWWCFWPLDAPGAAIGFFYGTLDQLNSLHPGSGHSGPYATQQAAQDACYPTIGQPPAGPPAPPGPTPSGNLYFAVCFKGPNDRFQAIVVAADDPGTALNSVAGATKVQGPFTSNAEALKWLGDHPSFCAVGFACDIKPFMDCPDVPAALKGIGKPGTREWCDALESIVKTLGGIGNQLYAFINRLLDTKAMLKALDDWGNDPNTGPTTKPLIAFLRWVLCLIGPLAETLRLSVDCAHKWVDGLFPECNSSALFGLLALRHFLLSLERIEWGSDAGVWITAVSGFTIDPFMTTLDYLIRYSCPIELMDEASALEAYKYDYMDWDVAKCIVRAHGKQADAITPAIMARGEKPAWKEVIQYLRRHKQNGSSEDVALRKLGVLDPTYRKVLGEIYDELPTISDHLEWLRKNVFDDEYVRDFKLMDGFEERFWKKFGDQLRALGMTKENASLHYAAHWINPSFSQLFEMTQRNRPGRVPDDIVFTTKDLLRVMQEQDVGVFFRERLESISHPVPNLTLTIQLYEFNAIDDNQFVEMLLDLGYTERNARTILAGQVIKVRRRNASTGHGWTPVAMANAYAVGAITERQVRDEMTFLGYDKLAVDKLLKRAEIEFTTAPVKREQRNILAAAIKTQEQAYVCGAINKDQYLAVLNKANIPDRVAAIAAVNADATVEVKICGQQIASFRQAVLKGKATLGQVATLLSHAGVPPLRAKQYLDLWAVELSLRNPAASAGAILRWVGAGLLDVETARQRLLNLGWADPDMTLMLAEASGKLSQRQARIVAAQTKSRQAAVKAAAVALRQNQAEGKRLRAILRGNASVRTLQKWFRLDLITEPELTEYILERGYPPGDTRHYVQEAIDAKSKPPKAKGKGKSTPPAPQPGGGAGPAAP